MAELFAEPWFWPAALVIVGLPITLLVLTEIHAALARSGRGAARIVRLVRDWVVPLGALLVLLAQTRYLAGDVDWFKVTATAFGFLVVLVLINGVNLVVFTKAREGSWRQRLPKIFIDLGRALLIVVAVAIIFSWVWGADVGGLFTALGVGSIVIGLALQGAVGPVVAGLFLLFERPFQVDDWLMTGFGKGRVVEVNWRATHFDTNNGLRVVPNSALAGDAFVNLSRARNPYEASVQVRFATDDPPDDVLALVLAVATDLPQRHPESGPSAIPLRKGFYEVGIPLASPGSEWGAVGLFRRRLWYAARRAGLHLDRDLTDPFTSRERTRAALTRLAPRLSVEPPDIERLLESVRLERYGEGECVQRPATVPDGVRYIVSGEARMSAEGPAGEVLHVADFGRDDALGLTSLTRQGIASSVVALTPLTVLLIPVETLDELVRTRRSLAREYGREIDNRRDRTFEAFAAAGLEPPSGSRLIAY
ncbi:mechanosensitive ion channel family protein [uncultured Schumannella sp.]|uniref:mechanosensitive ion channel family protein n=1 Tax=uncultured Schumannella sp. TaxID=1195956 RepID=UPI0025DF4D34|nr:mechanosensitive ion channel family protein [uncultured Schumannella sp.]